MHILLVSVQVDLLYSTRQTLEESNIRHVRKFVHPLTQSERPGRRRGNSIRIHEKATLSCCASNTRVYSLDKTESVQNDLIGVVCISA